METAEQREQRVARLEAERARRRGASEASRGLSAATSPEGAVEIAPGRGDMRRNSLPGLVLPELVNFLSLVDGKQVSFAKIFAEQPWVAAAVMRMLTWSVRVPLKVYRRTGDDSRVRLRADEHPLAKAIEAPWEGGYMAALTMSLLGPLLVHGNSVLAVEEGRSGRIQFEPLDWRFLTPILASAARIAGWQVQVPNESHPDVSADSALHVKWWSPLGPEGISPLKQLGTTISLEDAAMRYQRANLRNGARPSSAIEASTEFLGLDKDVQETLLAQLREDVTTLYAGPENGGRPALLPPGLEWKPIGHSSVEAELIQTRLVDREEIAAVYQIPPPSLGDLRRATFSNITELRQVAYSDGLGPPLVLVEQVITSQLIRGMLREDDVYVEFDFAGVLRGDFLKEINALRLAIGSGLMSPNEGRAKINMPQSDDERADQLWMPWNNLQPMGEGPPQNNRRQRRQGQAALKASADHEDTTEQPAEEAIA